MVALRFRILALAALAAFAPAAAAEAAPKAEPAKTNPPGKAKHAAAAKHAARAKSARAPSPAMTADAPRRAAPSEGRPRAWCAEELEALPNGLCHIDGGRKGDRRTLVVFLHGAIAKDVDWQWLQERALARQARQSGFEAIFARAPLGASGYVWPGSRAAQAATEQGLIDEWSAARRFLEERSGQRYDEVFLMGFSSGAYFVSSLALRGRGSFDGYAVFAGGSGRGGPAEDVSVKAPVYVGVCAADKQTADHSRAFGRALASHGWPSRVDEQKVGHMFSDLHVAHALAYLRRAKRPSVGPR